HASERNAEGDGGSVGHRQQEPAAEKDRCVVARGHGGGRAGYQGSARVEIVTAGLHARRLAILLPELFPQTTEKRSFARFEFQRSHRSPVRAVPSSSGVGSRMTQSPLTVQGSGRPAVGSPRSAQRTLMSRSARITRVLLRGACRSARWRPPLRVGASNSIPK